MKNLLTIIAMTLSIGAQAQAAELGPVARDASGEVLELDFPSAVAYCASIGQRLPNQRELAAWAIARGARGIRESKFVGMDWRTKEVDEEKTVNWAEGYRLVEVEKGGHFVADFYFSAYGYTPAPGVPRTLNSFWSGTRLPDEPNYNPGRPTTYGAAITLNYGALESDAYNSPQSIICATE